MKTPSGNRCFQQLIRLLCIFCLFVYSLCSAASYHALTPPSLIPKPSRFFFDAYQDIFKLIETQYDERSQNHGYRNIGFYPDDQGSYYMDNYGMPGIWTFTVHAKENISKERLLRTADACSIALDKKLKDDHEYYLSVVSSIPGDKNGLAAIHKDTILVTPAFVKKSRDEQVEVLRQLLAGFSPDTIPLPQNSIPASSIKKADILISQFAMVEPQRARDYMHYKFSYRLESLTEILKEQGYRASFLPVESESGIEQFLEHYRRNMQDIVVLSRYHLREYELESFHATVQKLKEINPNVFIIIEGPLTNIAKQLLSVSPDVDMFVRGESGEALKYLLSVKSRNKKLTRDQMRYLAARIQGGFYLRQGRNVIFSRFNRTNIDTDVRLLKPDRNMLAYWYTEHGCPNNCAFCRKDTGADQHLRCVSVQDRINWLLDRILLECDPRFGLTRESLKEKLLGGKGLEKYLKQDSFIKRTGEKVDIIILSENALVNRALWMDFSRMITAYGLQRFFAFKIADAEIRSFARNRIPDTEYIISLKDMGVYFIGFGTESLSEVILSQLGKGNVGGASIPYTADEIITVNKALLQAGFKPNCIRNNFIFTTPISTWPEVKDNILLTYLAPISNSVPHYLGNGWGNNRYGMLRPGIDSIWNHVDTIKHAARYGRSLAGYFLFSGETPEYKIPRPGKKRLIYNDPEVYRYADRFGNPSFYRFAQEAFIDRDITEADIAHAVYSWRESRSEEARTLAHIIDEYKTIFPDSTLFHGLIKMIKSHMVSLEELSFIDYYDLLQKTPDLPLLLEQHNISRYMASGDACLVPGSFFPTTALRSFKKAAATARIIKMIAARYPAQHKKILTGLLTSLFSRSASAHGITEFCRKHGMNTCVSELQRIFRDYSQTEPADFVEILSYPDRQQFEYIRHLYATATNNELLGMIVETMNREGCGLEQAVKELACRRLGIPHEEYSTYVKSVKEYESARVYFCPGGLLGQLRDPDGSVVAAAVRALLRHLEEESNLLIVKTISVNLSELGAEGGLLSRGAFVTTGKVLNKIRRSMEPGDTHHDLFVPGPSLVLIGRHLYNDERFELVRNALPAHYSRQTLQPLSSVMRQGNWEYIRLDNTVIHIAGTRETEQEILGDMPEKMHFRGNESLFNSWLGRIAGLSGRHRLQVLEDIRDYWSQETNRAREHARYLTHPAEEFLLSLPMAKMMEDDPKATVLTIASGMEPFFNKLWLLANTLIQKGIIKDKESISKFHYIPLSRRLGGTRGPDEMLASTIISLLEPEELNRRLDTQTIARIESLFNDRSSLQSLWNFDELKNKTLREAIEYICSNGIDPDFKKFFGSKSKLTKLRSFYFEKTGEQTFSSDEFIAFIKTLLPGADESSFIELGKLLDTLKGKDGTLSLNQQEMMYVYILIWWSKYQASAFREKLSSMHQGLDVLSIMLENTQFAHCLAETVYIIDDALTSGRTFLLVELMARAFNTKSAKFKYVNIAQRTRPLKEIVQASGLIDRTVISNIWLGEDALALYQGIFIQGTHDKRFHSFRQIASRLRDAQAASTPTKNKTELIKDMERFNKSMDDFIEKHGELFEFVEQVSTRRFSAKLIKRHMLKTILRKDDLLSYLDWEIFNDYITFITPFEPRFGGTKLYEVKIKELAEKLEEPAYRSALEPLKEHDIRVRNADRAVEFERCMDGAHQAAVDTAAVWHTIISDPAMKEQIRRFMEGAVSFEQIQKFFYANFSHTDSYSSFGTRAVHLNEQKTRALFTFTEYPHTKNKYDISFHSAGGFEKASLFTSPSYREALDRALAGTIRSRATWNDIAAAIPDTAPETLKEIRFFCQKQYNDSLDIMSFLFTKLREYEKPGARSLQKAGSPAGEEIISLKINILLCAAWARSSDKRIRHIIDDLIKAGTERNDIQRALLLYHREMKRPISDLLASYGVGGSRGSIVRLDDELQFAENDQEQFHEHFRKKNIMLIGTHPDDILNNIGITAFNLKKHARQVVYVTATPDHLGVTDEYLNGFDRSLLPRELDAEQQKQWIRSAEDRRCAEMLGFTVDRKYVNLGLELPFSIMHHDSHGRFLPKDSLCAPPLDRDRQKIEKLVRTHPSDVYIMAFPFSFHPQHRILARLLLDAISLHNPEAEIFFWQDYSEYRVYPAAQNMFYYFTLDTEKLKESIIKTAFPSQHQRKGALFYQWVAETTGRDSARISLEQAGETVSQKDLPYAERFICVRLKHKKEISRKTAVVSSNSL